MLLLLILLTLLLVLLFLVAALPLPPCPRLAPQKVADGTRRDVAQRLLAASVDDLMTNEGDFPKKIRNLFKKELEDASRDGRCDPAFHGVVALYRSKLDMQTQDLEGRNSKLQSMLTRAPAIGRVLANARM